MARLDLSLLGSFQATLDDRPVAGFESNKVRALLAYLAIEAKRPHRRETLASFLWPDRPDRDALANLRYALSNLRRAIDDRTSAPPFLLITNGTLQFNPFSDHWVDATALCELLAQHDVPALQRGVALYTGDFLEGFTLADAAPFEEWAERMREQLSRDFLSALGRLADHFEAQGDYQSAARYARQAVDHAPWQEEAHQQLMRVLALGGNRTMALAQFEACRRLLGAELDVTPARDTVVLYEAIRDDKLIAPRQAAALAAHPDIAGKQQAWQACVAREPQLARLNGYLARAIAGSGAVVFVVGEAGSGKTVLLEEFVRRSLAAHTDLTAAGGRCNAYTGHGDPYLPFLEILHLLTGDLTAWPATGKLTEEHARRLLAIVPDAAQALLDRAPDLIDRFVPGAMLLARVQAAGRGPSARLEAWLRERNAHPGATSAQQANLFEQFTHALHALARLHPVLLVLDDLQWADAGSIGLLFHLGRRLAGHRILIVGAYRPDDLIASREGQGHPLQAVIHELQRERGDIQVDLAATDGRQFVEALLDIEPNCLGALFRQTLTRHTGGHPLFTVEFLRGLEERGDLIVDSAGRWMAGATLDWETLPPRVEAVIAERVSRLPQRWQALLEAASVEGEAFSAEILARVLAAWRPTVAADEPDIPQCLSGPLGREHRLVLALGVERIGDRRLSRYRFRHFLFQKYLYGKLDAVERAYLHEAVAHELEALPGLEAGSLAVQLAWHYESAGMADKAIMYLRQAGTMAGRLGSAQEAIEHYQHGLQLLASQPETSERAVQELPLLIGLGTQLVASRGYAHPDVQRVYDRASALCLPLRPSPELVHALRGLGVFYSLRAEYGAARELYERIAVIAQQSGSSTLAADADRYLGYVATVMGEVLPARLHLERDIASRNSGGRSAETPVAPELQDPATVCHTWLGLSTWVLGYADQARAHSRQAQTAAERAARPFDVAFALGLAAMLHSLRHDVGATCEKAEAVMAVAVDKGFPFWLAAGRVSHGWAVAQRGEIGAGLAELRQGAEFIRLSGARQPVPWSLMLLAETLGQMGQIDEGLEVLTEALNEERRAGSTLTLPNLLHLRGELWLQQGEADELEAEACFHEAISVARNQDAKSWELRAALSLCHLHCQQGRHEEARAMLAGIYAWFTEGFDEPDLLEAKALLGQLGCA